jgi:hypothetical protein
MADVVRRRLRRNYPVPPQKFKSLDEVSDWARRLYASLSENIDEGYGGNIVLSSNTPTASDGRDGDLWIEHSET